MTEAESPRPGLNVYGKLVVGCLLAGVAMLLLGGSTFQSAGFVGLGVVVLAVAMRRNGSSETQRNRAEEDETGTDDTEMKAKAMAGGATGDG